MVDRGSCGGCLLVVSLAFCGGGTDGLERTEPQRKGGRFFSDVGGVMIALLYVALLVAADGSLDDDDDTAVGDGWSIDDYDAVLFICVGLLLCVRWGHCSREWSAAIDIFCQLV